MLQFLYLDADVQLLEMVCFSDRAIGDVWAEHLFWVFRGQGQCHGLRLRMPPTSIPYADPLQSLKGSVIGKFPFHILAEGCWPDGPEATFQRQAKSDKSPSAIRDLCLVSSEATLTAYLPVWLGSIWGHLTLASPPPAGRRAELGDMHLGVTLAGRPYA
jgi:hypothetical protein